MSQDERPYFAHAHLLDPPIRRAAYSDRTAWIMGQLSQLAYIRFEGSAGESAETATARLKSELAAGGFELLRPFEAKVVYLEGYKERKALKGLEQHAKTDTQAILVRSKDMAVLAYRGSEPNKVDWLYTDADAVFVELPDGQGKVHRGFYESFLSIRNDVEAAITDRTLVPDDLPLYITGHSLGGALSNIAGMELEKVRHLAAIYTLGSPRVGDEVWASRMKVPHYRIVNGRDVVPLLPFSNLIGNILIRIGLRPVVRFLRSRMKGYIGYQHVGDFRHLTQDGRLLMGSSATLSRLGDVILDGAIAIAKRTLLRRIVFAKTYGTDHFMGNYNGKLEKIALDRNPVTPVEARVEVPPPEGAAPEAAE